MSATFDAAMKRYVEPLSRVAGFDDVGGNCLATHHAFVVAYAIGKDVDLSFHVDSSDVTLNVCLGKKFNGGELFFRGVRCSAHQNTPARPFELFTYKHRPGRALLHRGRHRHGAHAIRDGERFNLILWCRAPKGALSSEQESHFACEGFGKRRRENQPDVEEGGSTHALWCWLHETHVTCPR